MSLCERVFLRAYCGRVCVYLVCVCVFMCACVFCVCIVYLVCVCVCVCRFAFYFSRLFTFYDITESRLVLQSEHNAMSYDGSEKRGCEV